MPPMASALFQIIQGTPQQKTYFDNIGKYTSDFGKVGDANQKLHDSNYYQDFSYLIKSKSPMSVWRSLIK